MILDLTNKLVCFYLKFDRYTNGYHGKEKNCQFTLLFILSFIGQFINPVGGKGIGLREGKGVSLF